MTATIGHTRQLVDFALDVYKKGLPEHVEKKMTELIIDQIGLQVACVRYQWSEAVHQYMTTFATPGKSTVVYFGDKLSPEQAAFANGAFGHGQDYDDTVMKVQTHPGAVVIPVGLAMGEEVGANGRDVLNAIAAGMEVMLRVAHSVSPYCLSSGVHTPPAAGTFGAAIVAGLLLGLSRDELVNALGIAGSFSGGLLEYTQAGGSVKRIHCAIPTTAGIRAAYLSRFGMTGPETVLEGNKGFVKVFSHGQGDVERLTLALGEEFRIEWVALKNYNCCYFIHAPLEALLHLQAEHGLVTEDIEAIKIGTGKQGTVHVGKIPEPTDELGAQFSLHFTLPMGFLKGIPGINSYSEEILADEEIRAMAKKVTVYEDATASEEYPTNWGGIVTVVTKDGHELSHRVRYPKGNPENPMSHEEIERKFHDNCTSVVELDYSKNIFNMLVDFVNIGDITDLTKLLAVRVQNEKVLA
jgi:2-methylcitrate dehydratase PrpD